MRIRKPHNIWENLLALESLHGLEKVGNKKISGKTFVNSGGEAIVNSTGIVIFGNDKMWILRTCYLLEYAIPCPTVPLLSPKKNPG